MLTDNDHFIAEVKYHFGIGIDQSFTAVLNRHDIDIIAAAQIGFDQVFPCQTWRDSDTHQADGIRQFDIIDDTVGNTLVSASTLQKEVKAELEKTNDVEAAAYLGKVIAERAKAKGIDEVVFDRGGFIYQGKIKALADAAREAGLNF